MKHETQPNQLPKFSQYLEDRKYENNLDIDFRQSEEYRVYVKKQGCAYIFDNQKQTLELSIDNEEYLEKEVAGTSFEFVIAYKLYDSLTKGIVANKNCLLIYPYFSTIDFIQNLNVFKCQQSEYIYFFDIKGRYLGKESITNPQSLGFAYLDNERQEVIKIKLLPEGFNVSHFVSYNLIKVYKHDSFYGSWWGLADHKGNILIEAIYDAVFINSKKNYAVLMNYQKDKALYSVDLSNYNLQKLSYAFKFRKFISECDLLVVEVDNTEKETEKIGVINFLGKEIIKPIYDHITYTYFKNKAVFKVFIGNYDWIEDETFQKLYQKHHKEGYFFEGKMDRGKWGIVDENSKIIVPIEYDWIEEFTENLYLLNQGGTLCLGTDEDRFDSTIYKEFVIFGGLWGTCDTNGNIIDEVKYDNIEDIYPKHENSNKYGIKVYRCASYSSSLDINFSEKATPIKTS